MKNFNTKILILTLLFFIVSCKTIKKVNCDAYGTNNLDNSEFDIQKINSESSSKYVTTYVIR
jgi:hypothetical protein